MLAIFSLTLLVFISHAAAFVSLSFQATRKSNYAKNNLTVSLALFSSQRQEQTTHSVNGIECVEVTVSLPQLGPVTILEATAGSQDLLVNLALEDEQEQTINSSSLQLPTGDPYGAVLWPASLTIASRLLNDISIKNQSIVEIGAGTGLVSIAAAMVGARSVLATDYEQIPLQLLQYAAKHLNSIPDIDSILSCQHFDLCDFDTPLPSADLVVAADIMYEPKTGKAMAKRVAEALNAGSRVLIGDSPGRAGRPAFLEELKLLGINDAAFVDRVGSTVTGARHDLICGPGSTSISDTPQELTVAVIDLDPINHLPSLLE